MSDSRPSGGLYHGLRYEMDADRLGLIMSFVSVAEHLSFVEAAKEMNVMSSTISRQISKLEDSLGVRLLSRTTRRVSLTEAGEIYLRECTSLLHRLAEADALVGALNSEPRGHLRVSVPVSLGRLHVNQSIGAFVNLYPKVQVYAEFTDRYVDIVGEGFDVVIRIGNLPDSGLIAKRIGLNERVIVASPRYISVHGVPSSPADLVRHNCLRYNDYNSSGTNWQFQGGDEKEVVEPTGNYISNHSDAIADVAVAGQGIAMLARYQADPYIQSGQLVPLLQEWSIEPTPGIYLMYPSTRYLAPKVKAFSNFVTEYFRRSYQRRGRPSSEDAILDDLD